MDVLLILTYVSICVAVFKIFKIPLNKWTVPTAALGGIFLIGALIVLMNYNHPFSEISRSYYRSVPIVPEVSGHVIEVTDKVNARIEKDELLLAIDPTPFKAKLESLQADMVQARTDLARAKKLVKTNALAKRELDIAQRKVDSLEPKIEKAQWDLDNTTIEAPSAGFVTQVGVSPGVRAVSLPLSPVMTFIPLQDRMYVGWFRQNSMLRLNVGYEAEVALDGLPGQVFTAEVKQVLPAMSQGQIPPSGTLRDDSVNMRPGRIAVVMEITDPEFDQYEKHVPGGAMGQAAIYSDKLEHVAIMRKVLLRMASWMNYLFPFH